MVDGRDGGGVDGRKGDGSDAGGAPPTAPNDREFGRQGWLLLGAVVVALGVVPVVILMRPPDLPFVAAYLVLPLLPAVVLALVAVYVTASR